MHKASIVIPQRQEPRLADTVRRVLETAKLSPEIIVVNDGNDSVPQYVQDHARVLTPWPKSIGLQMSRDVGIEAASNPTVILLDAHMQFRDKSEWDRILTEWSVANPSGIGCAICEGVCGKTWKMAAECEHCKKMHTDIAKLKEEKAPRYEPGKRYGARILWTEKSTAQNGKEEFKIFPSKWNEGTGAGPGIVQGVLGGCYVMQRERYLNALARPWRGMRAWGTSEQTLSIVNWLCGGFCECLDVGVGHWFRKAWEIPYPATCGDKAGFNHQAGIWFNRWRLLQVLPMAEKTRKKLLDWLAQNKLRTGINERVIKWLCMDSESWKLRWLLEVWHRTLEDYKAEWGI
jgi:glycosyltransferase involved in cell wall biosynthesis